MLAMLALCSQENPPTPLSILFNSEGPKNSVRILCPEFSMSVSEPLTCSSWKRNWATFKNLESQNWVKDPKQESWDLEEWEGNSRRLHDWGYVKSVPGPQRPICPVTMGNWHLLWLPWVQQFKKKSLQQENASTQLDNNNNNKKKTKNTSTRDSLLALCLRFIFSP